jgi:hypothetical protein
MSGLTTSSRADSGPGAAELTPEVLCEGIGWIEERRAAAGLALDGYDVVVEGTTPPDPVAAAAVVRPWAAAGATWWLEADWSDMDPDRVRATARARLCAGRPMP